MHAGKWLARLNPATVRYDIGRGGVPEITPQDIAAALAMVPEGLGRELLCRLWWPDGAALTARDLDRLLMEAQLAEWRTRAETLLDAQLISACAETASQRERARVVLEQAKASMWPRLGPCYAAIRKAVLLEISAERLCAACKGRGVTLEVNKMVPCAACEGSGRILVSDRARADLIARDKNTYLRAWRPVYEWTIQLCTELIAPAQRHFTNALR